MDSQFFPIGLEDLKARKWIYSLDGGEKIRLKAGHWKPKVEKMGSANAAAFDGVTVEVHRSDAHPRNGVLLYRVSYENRSVVYATDIEEKAGGYPDVIEFVRNTDVLIHDAQYLSSECNSRVNSRKGWGHSTFELAAAVAIKAGVKRLILFHHEPTRMDEEVRAIEKEAQKLFVRAAAAYEGMEIDLINESEPRPFKREPL